jgi:hypothetical protein
MRFIRFKSGTWIKTVIAAATTIVLLGAGTGTALAATSAPAGKPPASPSASVHDGTLTMHDGSRHASLKDPLPDGDNDQVSVARLPRLTDAESCSIDAVSALLALTGVGAVPAVVGFDITFVGGISDEGNGVPVWLMLWHATPFSGCVDFVVNEGRAAYQGWRQLQQYRATPPSGGE